MLNIPYDVLTSGVLVHLSIRDLQAVNVAFTSTPTHRARIQELWKSYPYECPDEVDVTSGDVKWLKSVDVKPVGLVMSNTVQHDADLVEFIATNFPTLRKLVAHFYCKLNDSTLKQLAIGCPLLEVLHIPPASLTHAGILALVQNCRQLHTLDIFHNRYSYNLIFLDAAVDVICTYCSHLKHIGLSSYRALTDASLIAIANTYPHLQSLQLTSVPYTDDGLISIADKCHELRSVSVRCDNITSRGLTALWAANPNLMDVDISHNRFISDDDIIQLVQCCPLLQKLNMSYCYQITDAAVIAVAEHCPQLRSLNISGCQEVSDASFIALGQHCHDLKSIDMSLIYGISEVGIAALAAGCPLLQEFNAGSTYITNDGLVALARGCRDLRKLDLNRSNMISVDGMSVIAENCSLLSELDLTRCEGVDYACLHAIAQRCRNLKLFAVDYDFVTSLHLA